MGIYVEEEWRYRKKGGDGAVRSLRASQSAFAYKIEKVEKEKEQKVVLKYY